MLPAELLERPAVFSWFKVHGQPWKPHRKRGLPHAQRTSLWERVREYIWPSMGLSAFLRWMWVGLLRQAGRPHYVALGFACGAWVSFFPILGTHILIVALLCWLLRGSFIAGLAGTMVGNPWTYGPIWASGYQLGADILHLPKGSAMGAFEDLHWTTVREDFSELFSDVLLPTMVGGAILGLLMAVVCYFLVYWQVTLWRKRRAAA